MMIDGQNIRNRVHDKKLSGSFKWLSAASLWKHLIVSSFWLLFLSPSLSLSSLSICLSPTLPHDTAGDQLGPVYTQTVGVISVTPFMTDAVWNVC